jgi:hypothetical protein
MRSPPLADSSGGTRDLGKQKVGVDAHFRAVGFLGSMRTDRTEYQDSTSLPARRVLA